MTAEDLVKIIVGGGTFAAIVLKAINELQKTVWTGKARAEKVKADANEVVRQERQANYDNLKRDFDQLVLEVRELREREHRVEKRLVKAHAWIAHLEAALENSKIPYVPFSESDDGEDSPAPRTKSNPPINIPPKRRNRKGGEDV